MTKRKKDFFDTAQDAAIGTAGLGLTTAIGAGIASKAPAGTPNLTQGFSTIAGFAPIATTAVLGGAVLGTVRKLNKKKRRK